MPFLKVSFEKSYVEIGNNHNTANNNYGWSDVDIDII